MMWKMLICAAVAVTTVIAVDMGPTYGKDYSGSGARLPLTLINTLYTYYFSFFFPSPVETTTVPLAS